MSFDWKQESKERYFRKAEKIIKAAGFSDLLIVNRNAFGTMPGKVKVYFKPFYRKGNMRRWWKAAKTINGIEEISAVRDEYGKKRKGILLHGYIVLEMEAKDR